MLSWQMRRIGAARANQARRDQEASRGRRVVLVNVAKLVRRELQDRKARRGQQVRRDQEGNPACVVRQDLLDIRKIAYLHRF